MSIQPPILKIALPVPFRRYFDYLLPIHHDINQYQPGMRVSVPFGRRQLTGIFMQTAATSAVPIKKLKYINELIDSTPLLPANLLTLTQQAAQYYHHPIGEVLANLLPTALRQGKPIPETPPLHAPTKQLPPLTLNPDQQAALAAITAARDFFQVFLLAGITGSGKTEVYLQALAALAKNRQVLVLIPEIGLTPQTLQRFYERVSAPIVTLHSGMTPKARLTAWLQVRSGAAGIVIGTRSAVFAPFQNLGLIIVDEEHDPSFKQQEGFRYHARDIAILRARQLAIPIVLGSATPALESLHNVNNGRYQLLSLPQRAGVASQPHCQLIDMRKQQLSDGLSAELIQSLRQHLARGEQVMLFLNRRGFAPVLLCHSCGWSAICTRCDKRMTWHKRAGYLLCHHCTARKKVPTACAHCATASLIPVGMGTEKLAAALSQYFPDFPIAQIDRDHTRKKGELEQTLARITCGEARILTGTQMLAKGHHFPNVTLVAIIDADGSFFSSDFRALERMGQLLLQVAGRAGRADKAGTVLIQTHHPHHPLLQRLLQNGYDDFAHVLLNEREQTCLPPYRFLALLRAEAQNDVVAQHFLREVKQLLHDLAINDVEILGPLPAPMPRRAGYQRMQLLLQSAQRPALHHALRQLMPQVEILKSGQKVRWSLDVDPAEIA